MAGGYELADCVNQALRSIGWTERIADLEDGSDMAAIANDLFWTCRQGLLRAAHWDFAMRQAPLTLLADASGNTPNVGTVVMLNFLYEYSYPTDCMKMRYIPWNLANPSALVPTGNIQIPTTPLVTGLGQLPPGARIIPAKFRISTDYNYPPAAGSDTTGVQGVSPQSRTVVLCNVKDAQAVYTADMLYPSTWDPLFREAFVAYLGVEMAVPVWAKKDPSQKTGIATRDRLIPIVRDKLQTARATNGNEGTSSSSIAVDWMRIRQSGGPYSQWGFGGAGNWNNGDGGVGWGSFDGLMVSGSATL